MFKVLIVNKFYKIKFLTIQNQYGAIALSLWFTVITIFEKVK
ncbi:MAG: hypothetical protein JWP45_2054 [Mucilaginibacter sp.]|nr:hypothetical protein [Mucilaginibacter sp.]